MGLLMFPKNAVFKTLNENTGKITLDEFINNGFLVAMLLLFLIPGIVFGKTTGKIKNSHDVVAAMTDAMESMGGYLVLAFFAAQFVNYFSYTNLGTILSVKGLIFYKILDLGLPLILPLLLYQPFKPIYRICIS